MSDGFSLLDGLLAIVIVLVISNLVFSLVKVNSEFETLYEDNIELIESDMRIIYEQQGIYLQ